MTIRAPFGSLRIAQFWPVCRAACDTARRLQFGQRRLPGRCPTSNDPAAGPAAEDRDTVHCEASIFRHNRHLHPAVTAMVHPLRSGA